MWNQIIGFQADRFDHYREVDKSVAVGDEIDDEDNPNCISSEMRPYADDIRFAKAIVVGEEAVGFHASMRGHEMSTTVAAGADRAAIPRTIHVHPTLSEDVQGTFQDIRDVAPSGI